MKIETLEVSGFIPALHGMRNPKNSWDRGASVQYAHDGIIIGYADMKLAQQLVVAGTEHSKFMRQIQVWADFTMPRYWWSEADTYGFGTKNSCSTMHTISNRHLTMEEFEISVDDLLFTVYAIEDTIDTINQMIDDYKTTKDYNYVIQIKKMLPESFLQMRTWNTNYAELRNIYFQRKNHRLKEEWIETFCKWIESLPYSKELIMYEK